MFQSVSIVLLDRLQSTWSYSFKVNSRFTQLFFSGCVVFPKVVRLRFESACIMLFEAEVLISSIAIVVNVESCWLPLLVSS